MGKLKKLFMAPVAVIIASFVFAVGCSGTAEETDGQADSSSQYTEENFGSAEGGSSTEEAENTAGVGIEIYVSTVTTTAKFYDVTIDGLTVEVLAVKATDTTIRLAFNTCQVCNGAKKAYFVQSGYYLVCQNCKSKISINKVGQTSGSCNPVPITSNDYTESNGIITVPLSYLESNASLFKRWKDN